jgi:hypothetical protein
MSTGPGGRPSCVTRPYVVQLSDAMSAADIDVVREHVELLLRRRQHVVCLVEGADLRLVDALAHLHLLAARHDGTLVVRSNQAMDELLQLVGLSEMSRQAEPLEDRDVQEVVDVRDAPL